MNVLVILRPVRDPAGFTVNRKAQRVFVNREAFIVNPADRNALEAALTLSTAGASVTALALGGEPALDALRMARAAGAGRAVFVSVSEAPALDALALTTIVRHVVDHLGGIDLVLLGAEVLDSDTAQVGARLAAALGWPFVDGALQITAQPDGALSLVVCAADGYRLLGVDMPAVAAIARDSNKPRFAPAGRIVTIYTDPAAVQVLTLADLGLGLAGTPPVTERRGESFLAERTLENFVQGEAAIWQLADAIRNG